MCLPVFDFREHTVVLPYCKNRMVREEMGQIYSDRLVGQNAKDLDN